MGSQISVDASVHVVVVGGGFGGIAAASQLQSWGVPFTLVDMRDSFHHNVAALRASVQSGFAKKTFISFAKTFGDSFRQDLVVGLDLEKQNVLLQGGEALSYSHLILATGSTGPFPGKFNQISNLQSAIEAYEVMVKQTPQRPSGSLPEQIYTVKQNKSAHCPCLKMYASFCPRRPPPLCWQVQNSQHIVVVGGGSAGVEMAAELKTDYPEKEVTLIHSKVPLADPELLPCVRQEVKEILLQKGVELLLSERVSNLEELPLNECRDSIQVKTDKGTQLAANLVILCNGIKINSSAYSSALGDQMADNGALMVNDHLQVQGFSNIYAIGDCANVKEPKMAYHAGLHANVVVTNIVNSLKQKPLKTYKPGALTFLLSMGRNDGVGQISGFYVGRLVVRFAKSRDLFVSTSWKTMRQTAPS
ncbi:apoptosis-inducing factor 2 isoform X1 [Vombatus ursinus]|uniref:apoptosis-inducing factor 2 isoform X1 n=1 Tax=Vombatus ursinus TaxID=29139 RepID=UPI000FFDAAB3|nr:apoptosis-inducing factor 2 isoform X1 [Vombatus ursinus]XP_027696422.1 apoptosis-inducing factor 2 isoform X1 [Vombatus ursinus]XP_027696423.1 apoptosis-inducing factor 2 isoform X1 [Vombatus ursinus]